MDQFQQLADSPDFSARRLRAVVPNDGANLTFVSKALYVGGAGNIAVLACDDVAAVTIAVQAGTLLPVRALRVLATGTTATGIVSLS